LIVVTKTEKRELTRRTLEEVMRKLEEALALSKLRDEFERHSCEENERDA